MTYATLMVHLDVGSPNDAVLRVAAGLAGRFEAEVIGIAACQPMPVMYSDGFASGELVEMDIVEIAKETAAAEASFRASLDGRCARLAWRSIKDHVQLVDYVARQALAADLVITGPDTGWSAIESSRRVVVSDLVLHAGRPVLIVPPRAAELRLDSVVVAWKDTREARRAIADALPLLKRAARVVVVEIAPEDDITEARQRLADVVEWLGRHGVASDCLAAVSTGDNAAQLRAVAQDRSADLTVAGAYRHNRLREWVLGGVTRDLLVHSSRCSLVSH